jgi:hypothetical protein
MVYLLIIFLFVNNAYMPDIDNQDTQKEERVAAIIAIVGKSQQQEIGLPGQVPDGRTFVIHHVTVPAELGIFLPVIFGIGEIEGQEVILVESGKIKPEEKVYYLSLGRYVTKSAVSTDSTGTEFRVDDTRCQVWVTIGEAIEFNILQ